MAEIFIARHGQNVDNVNGILNGHRDLPLTDIGRQQAHDLARGIQDAGVTFDSVYSSPLIRALETAEIVCSTLDIAPPIIEPDLIERNFGKATGRPIVDVVAEAGKNVIKTAGVTYVLSFEGGETFTQAMGRAQRVIQHVHELQPEGSALLVCHGDIGKMIYAAATQTPWEEVLHKFHFGNAELIDISSTNVHTVKLPQYNL